MGAFEKLIEKHVPGVNYIKSLMIGSSPTADTTNGFLMPVNDQIDMACELIKNDTKLGQGWPLWKFSKVRIRVKVGYPQKLMAIMQLASVRVASFYEALLKSALEWKIWFHSVDNIR